MLTFPRVRSSGQKQKGTKEVITVLPWIGDYQWQIWLYGGFLGVIVSVIGIYCIVILLNILKLPELLPEIVGWFGFLLTVSGVVGLMLSAIYIALLIIFSHVTGATGLAIYELFMVLTLGATIVGYILIMMNSLKGTMEFRWQFFEQRIDLRWVLLGQISFLMLKVGIIGLIVWGGWVAQEFDILKLDLVNLNDFTRTLLYSSVTTGLGQILKIGGHDSYTMSIVDGILVLRFEFSETPKRKKVR